MKNICVLLTNDYEYDSRVKRECLSLSKKYNVDLFCLSKSKSKVINLNKNLNVHRIHFKYPLNKLMIYFFGNNLFLNAVKNTKKCYDLIWANDVDTIKIGYILKQKYNAKLVYDSHEYWRGALGGDNFLKEIYKRIYSWLYLRHENKYINTADIVFTVNEIIAQQLKKDYQLSSIAVLYNVPKFTNSQASKDQNLSIVYVGKVNSYINIIKSLSHKNIIINHYGKNEKIGLDNFYYCGFIPEDELVPTISKYGVGLVLYSAIGLNEKYSTPNKFFQYIQAGLPVIVNKDCVFMSELVEKYKIGLTYSDTSEIPIKFKEIINNYSYYSSNVKAIKKKFCWENEEKKLLNILKEVI